MQTLAGKRRWVLALIAGLSLMTAVTGPAMAACYQSELGCTDDHSIPIAVLERMSCDDLWTIRNAIYNDRGYCFKTAAGADVFDNSDCYVDNASDLEFNGYEQTNINRVVAVEKEFACH